MKKNLFSHSSANMGDSRTARSVTFRTVVILFVLLLALESFLQYENNRSNSYATTAATISNIQEVVVKNEENIQTLSDTLKEAIKSFGGRNEKSVMALLDVDALKASKDQSTDIKKALEAVKESDAYLFGADEPFLNPVGPTGGNGGTGGDTMASIRAAMGLPEKK